MLYITVNSINKGGGIMKKAMNSQESAIDPVCLMKIDPCKKDLKYNYQAQTYYFCAEGCRKTFESNPEKYFGNVIPKRKGIWGRYLDRLAKTTGGKAVKCH